MTATRPQSPLPEAAWANSKEIADSRRTGGSFNTWLTPYKDSDVELRIAAPSPVAQAPAQAGEVAKAVAEKVVAAIEQAYNETEQSVPRDFCGEASDAAYGAVMDALATQPLAAPEAVALPDQTDFSRWVVRAYREAFAPDQTFSIHNMHVAYTAGMNREATRKADRATPPAHPVLAPVVREPLSEEQLDKIAEQWVSQRATIGYDGEGRPIPGYRITEYRMRCFARAVIQATTGEQSHG